MNTEEIFSLLVEANPVPDPQRRVEPADVPLRLVSDGSHDMQTIETTIEPTTDPTDHERRPRRLWIAAAAAALVLLGIGALLIVTNDDEPSEPVDQPTTSVAVPDGVDPADAAAATAAASDFYRAIESGDLDTATAMSSPFAELAPDQAMWEMNAYAAANGVGETIGDCRAIGGSPGFVLAGCDITTSNPVWNALGFTDALAPIRYYTDGTVQWQPYLTPDGGTLDFSDANRAVVEYLREFAPEQYDASCNPAGYEANAVVNAWGLALTRQCAEVWVPLVDDIAAWVVDTGFGS